MTCTGVHPDCMSGGPRCACARIRPSTDDDQMWQPVPSGSGTVTLSGTAGPVTTVTVPPSFVWPAPPRLHPGDIEAIARRVAELLRGAP